MVSCECRRNKRPDCTRNAARETAWGFESLRLRYCRLTTYTIRAGEAVWLAGLFCANVVPFQGETSAGHAVAAASVMGTTFLGSIGPCSVASLPTPSASAAESAIA